MPSPDPASRSEPHAVAPIGCQNCRDQHLKCDRGTPTCGRCLANGRECIRGYKFRVKTGPFARRQEWIRTPKKLKFVDESTGDFTGDDEESPPAQDQFQDDWQSPSADSRTVSTTDIPVASVVPVPVVQPFPIRPASPTDRFIVHDDLSEQPEVGYPVLTTERRHSVAEINSLRARIYLDQSVYPLRDRQEAILLRHFVEKIAIWLDLCDPVQSFEVTVPSRAGTCSILVNAIFAVAAKHLSHISAFDRYASDRYHQECLDILIPLLSHDATVSDENLFAATIILRVWEEMEVKHSGVDAHSYLLGIHAFVQGHGRYLIPGSLSAACFWVGLRQEIYSATMNQQPVRIHLVHSLVERGLGPADDYTWANRAVVHCADVLNFCFGDKQQTPEWWDDLERWNRQWKERIPASFTPVFERERQTCGAFPEIWYYSSCHVIGVQHHILAELFLVSFDPKIPRIGGQRREAAKRVNERIQNLVRRVCGIGLGNQWTPPSMFTACMAIAAFGDRFLDRADQEAFLDILKRTEKDHARPTEAVQKQMMKSWDWMVEQ
ncbi:Arca-like protein [Pleurostoma richardsiae]|uniref:Arca-like protein n=1 Tax=Pleurostoma richardsiae TaxID=41990 RepID=A0AA38RDA1_9PEZI|nr:Arca-like protein [Pleurostoma richardsiae]